MQLKNINILKKASIGIIGIIGISIILILTILHNTGITPDSVAYISVARSLTEGGGFVTFDGFNYVLQPPLYPSLLASIKEITTIDPIVSAGYLNALLFGLIIYLSGLFFLKHLKSFLLVLLGTAAVLISSALVQVTLMALSEPLFIILVLLFLYYLEKYISKPDILSLLLFSLAATLACLTRYTGVIIILTGMICIFLWGRKNLKEKALHSIIFLIVTALPIGIWIIRNYILTGTLVGHRASSSYTLFDNLRFFYNTVIPWYLPLNMTLLYLSFIILIGTLWILFGLYPERKLNKEGIKLIGPSLLLVLLYSGIIIISSTTTAYDTISDRLLSPIYIPALFVLFFIADKILGWLSRSFQPKLITALFITCIIILISFPFKNTKHIIEDYVELVGWGYNNDSWKVSQTIEYLSTHKQLEKYYKFYSNEPEAVYILTNIKTKRSPAKTFYNSYQLLNIKRDPNDIWKNDESVCLIWFDKANRNFLFNIDELQKKIKMTEVAHLKDGEIYTFQANELELKSFFTRR